MASLRMWAGLSLLLSFAAAALSQTAIYESTVAVPEVEVRCGPSTQFYSTSKLRQGARVKVVEEKEGGWLAIEPPEGSFSWIEARLLGKHNGRLATVMVPEAPVRAGSALVDRSPDVVSTKLVQGAQVVILGEGKIADDGGKWLPIEAQKEYRYIPKTAVKTPTPVEALTARSQPPVGVVGAAPVAGSPPPAGGAEAVWQQAEQALGAGNVPEARRLYQLCAQTPGCEAKLLWWCQSRLDSLNQMARQPVVSLVPPVPAPQNNVAPLPPPQGQASAYTPRPGAPTATAVTPGTLRRAAFPIDGKQAYALTDSAGRLVMYATDQGNLNLEQWVGRSVSLAGTITYHGQLKRDYMLATGVTPLNGP